jgi:hypothetical protein
MNPASRSDSCGQKPETGCKEGPHMTGVDASQFGREAGMAGRREFCDGTMW